MGVVKSKIDLEQLALEIGAMTLRRQLYRTLKTELAKLGYWKQKKRGKPDYGIRQRVIKGGEMKDE